MSALNFTPKSIADIVVSSPQSRATLDQIITGQLPLRMDRSTVLLLSGPNGTGKTTLARFLPGAIEHAYFSPNVTEHEVPYRYVDCRQGTVGNTILDELEERIARLPAPNASRHYIICDEIDRLSSTAQERLYALTFLPGVVWILTTNHRARVDTRLSLDSIDLFLDSPSESKLAALAINIATQHGTMLCAQDATQIAKACSGSWRQVHERTLQKIGVPLQAWTALTRACERSRLIRFGQAQRPISTGDDLTPQYIDEMVFADAESAEVAARIVTGIIQPPVDQGMGILIFGQASTGRKTLARLLPESIEECQFQSREQLFESDRLICKSGPEGMKVLRQVNQLLKSHVLINRSGLRYITLVGVDSLSDGAQQDLKSLMNTTGVVFILIAKSVAGIDAGVLDRCRHRIYMPWPTSDQRHRWTTRCARALKAEVHSAEIEVMQALPMRGFRSLLGAISAAGNAAADAMSITRHQSIETPRADIADTSRIKP